MKTQTIVTEITHDDLVNLIATAWEGSNWLGFDIPVKSGSHVPKIENECREDRMARVLLAGYSILVKDYYAEDESDHYGNIKHLWRTSRKASVEQWIVEDISETTSTIGPTMRA